MKYMDGEEEVIDSLNLGVRPINAWMEPFEFTMYTEGRQYTVTVLDFTPSDGMFSVEGQELPFQVVDEEGVQLTMATNATEAGIVERQFVAITEGNRSAHIWPVVVELYEPLTPDVWELACEEATEFPFVEVPQTAHNIHHARYLSRSCYLRQRIAIVRQPEDLPAFGDGHAVQRGLL